MQLSLTQACTWKGLLLLVSCMILWISVTPTPYDQMSNEELYDNLLSCSHRTHVVARKMYKILNEDLLKVIISVSNAWIYPLRMLIPAVLTHLGSYDGMMGRAIELNYGNKKILEGAKFLLSRIQPGIEENDYPVWSSLKELRSSNKSIHLFAFCKFFYCLRKDTKKIKGYLQILRPNIIKNKW